MSSIIIKKILTIVIPTYNMEKYLHKCLDSLIVSDENMNLLEVLIINDGSKDSSSQIAHEYEIKYPQTFRVIDKENGNYGSCVNRGIAEAKGKYIKVLDADDSFDTHEFSSFISDITSIDVDMIISDFRIINLDDEILEYKKFDLLKNTPIPIHEVCSRPSFLSMQMHAVTYKRKMLTNMSYHQTEGISYTDQEWVFYPITEVNIIYYSPRCVYRYLVGREGQTMSNELLIRNISHTIKGTLKMVSYYSKLQIKSKEKEVYLIARIKQRLKYIYNKFLLENSKLPISQLVEVDSQLHSISSDIYDISNSIIISSKFKYRFIFHWRKEKRNTLIITLYKALMRK